MQSINNSYTLEPPFRGNPSLTVDSGDRESFSVHVDSGIEALDALSDEWRCLCAESSSDEPFYRPEWIGSHCRAFSREKELLIVTARLQGRLLAVLPLLRVVERYRGIPVRKLRATANMHSGRFDLVCASGEQGTAAVRALWYQLRALPEWDLIELPRVPEGGAADVLSAAARNDGFPACTLLFNKVPHMTINPSQSMGDDFAASVLVRPHFRSGYRRRLREARATCSVSLQRFDCADPVALETFFQLEASGWKGAAGSAILCDDSVRQFYEEVACNAARFGYFELHLLTFNSRAVAAHFGFNYRKRHYSLKIAYDESMKHFAPGHMIVGAMLQDMAQRGIQEFDFLGSVARWETEWTRNLRRHFTHYIFRKSIAGYGLYACESWVIPKLRRLRSHLFVKS